MTVWGLMGAVLGILFYHLMVSNCDGIAAAASSSRRVNNNGCETSKWVLLVNL